jgi:hypothetical protein
VTAAARRAAKETDIFEGADGNILTPQARRRHTALCGICRRYCLSGYWFSTATWDIGL